MNTRKPGQREPARGWRVILIVLFGGLAVLAVLIAAVTIKFRAEDRQARAEIQKRLDALRAAGQPLTAQDLANRYPDPPPERDARRMLQPALAKLSVPDTDKFPLFIGGGLLDLTVPLDEPTVAEAQHWLERNQATLDAIPWEQLPGSWIGSGFTNGLDRITESPSHLTDLTRLLCMDALVQAEQQHPKDAVEGLSRALAVGNTLKNDVPVHFMLKGAIHMSVCQALERVLNRVRLMDDDVRQLQARLTITNVQATKEYWGDERCLGLSVADALRTKATQIKNASLSPIVRLLKAYQTRLVYRDDELLDYLEWHDRCMAAVAMPMTNAFPAIAAIDREVDAASHRKVSFLNAFRKSGSEFFYLTRPRFLGFLAGEVKCVAAERTAATALAIERWRLAHDSRLPNSLSDLVPDFLPSVPMDPFDDQPLRFKKLDHGYVIYSVGPDFADDGGKEKPFNAKEGYHSDITFIVER